MTIDANDFIYPTYIKLNVLIENSQKRPKFKGLKTFNSDFVCSWKGKREPSQRCKTTRVWQKLQIVVVPVFEFSHKRVGFLQVVQIKTFTLQLD